MDSDSKIEVLYVNDDGKVTCNLHCDEPEFLDSLPGRRTTLAELRDALIQHLAHHHPTLVAMFVAEWPPRTRSRQHCVSTEHSCAIDLSHDDHVDRCCDCKRPLAVLECRPGRMVDPLRLDGR